nr:immunoglobulin light chain junction region [Macaca mulatta]MOV65914.1 immunoglobulin light chain junction region [Macaca mulatta]MOV65936.1 immunoglobulin light chain junction region [Macaca mulatta]MOV65971.1 immunoglobulin light chain junction region [Macaca mulatta]MOV66029.1 immunoglobulin light chain junction region [Macaca mulatta]
DYYCYSADSSGHGFF